MNKLIAVIALIISANSFALDAAEISQKVGCLRCKIHIQEVCVGGYVYVLHIYSHGSSMLQKLVKAKYPELPAKPEECKR